MFYRKKHGFYFAVLVSLTAAIRTTTTAEPQQLRRFRGPFALALVDDGKTLLVANRRSGSISIVDTATNAVTGEAPLGRKLSGLVKVPGQNRLLAIDEGAH